MKILKQSILLGLTSLLTLNVQAEDTQGSANAAKGGETSVKMENVSSKEDRKPVSTGQDVDEVITNRKLRAETGSKNAFSFSSALSYSGGSISKPFGNLRPNIRGSASTQTDVSIYGTAGVKYKISPLQSLSLDLGVGMDRPFADDQGIKYRSYATDPSLGYQVLYRVGGIQNVTQFSLTKYTNRFARKIGGVWSPGVNQIVMYDFGGSKFTVGALMAFDITYFDKEGPQYSGRQSDYSLGFYPIMEYVINDKINLRTISGLWNYEHIRSEGRFSTWDKKTIYQSIGVGISITRDLYLYPNIQFLPENIRSDATNVALNANINI
ncbi:MAG: hypothetical protein K1X29_11035 [Bdellovibrionales bacterium]|nr:hypothetical protein [Bdellovibrionales bacterium]